MGTVAQWNEVAAEVRAVPSPWSSPAVVRLFALAEEDGRVALRSFANELGDATVVDLIRGLLTDSLSDIVAAAEPRGYFWKAVVRRAISWKRKGSSRVEEAPEHEAPPTEALDTAEQAYVARLDLEAAWALLSPREQAILSALREGEDRDELARFWKTSRNNIDQIASRAKKRLAGEGA